jgi:hypothetical protein
MSRRNTQWENLTHLISSCWARKGRHSSTRAIMADGADVTSSSIVDHRRRHIDSNSTIITWVAVTSWLCEVGTVAIHSPSARCTGLLFLQAEEIAESSGRAGRPVATSSFGTVESSWTEAPPTRGIAWKIKNKWITVKYLRTSKPSVNWIRRSVRLDPAA